jgi:ribonuclease BN (tRNA processing enzyme)
VSSLVFLGTGPGTPVRGKFFSSCLLRTDGACLLVDAGEPCSQRLAEAGVSPAEIDAVLLTHGHSDHTAGFPMLLQAAWLAPRRRQLDVFLPGELIAPLRGWLRAVYLPPELLGFPVEFRSWRAGQAEGVAPGVRVTPFPTTHLRGLREIIEPSAQSGFEIFGLTVQCGGKRLVFSSDLGAPDDLSAALDTPCDVLVCELSHFSPEDLFSFLRGRSIGLLLLNHLSPELAGREEEIASRARRELPGIGRIIVPGDGEEIRF